MKHLTKFILTTISLFTTTYSFAQHTVNKGDVVIQIMTYDAWVSHKFWVDIHKKGNSVKIVYTYYDSLKHAEVRKDTDYNRLHKRLMSYDSNDPRRNPTWDSIGLTFKRHAAYSRDSITVKLKTDIAFKNLIESITQADIEKLTNKSNQRMLDGESMYINIITSNQTKKANAYAPMLNTHPLLIGFLKRALDEDKNSNVVQKIRKYYTWY